jgi:Icc protein
MCKLIISTLTGLCVILLLGLSSCGSKAPKTTVDDFSFVFMTDIHIQPTQNAPQGFKQVMDSIIAIDPDFVITGGDLIMDALEQSFGKADSLYNLYKILIQNLKIPVYNTMGNHEIYGIYRESGADLKNPEYGEKMFEKRFGKSYYSFDHKGCKFMIINSIEDTHKGSYIGWVDSTQMEWIKQELAKTDKETPILISTHIPFITAYVQKYYGSTLANDSSLVVVNSKDVIDLFKNHNLKLVLQGHLHTVEDIYIDGIHFITGGAVCGRWWQGANMGFEEGFMEISIKNNQISWKYKDYGWVVAK